MSWSNKDVLWSSMKKWPWPHKSLFMVWRPSANMTNSPKYWQWDICKYTVYIYICICMCVYYAPLVNDTKYYTWELCTYEKNKTYLY